MSLYYVYYLINFSLSPIHLETNELEEIEKKVDLSCDAIAFPIMVLPVPGGPKRRIPLAGRRTPLKISGRNEGYIMVSRIIRFTCTSPAMSFQPIPGPVSIISDSI